jgi:hypothetical protein
MPDLRNIRTWLLVAALGMPVSLPAQAIDAPDATPGCPDSTTSQLDFSKGEAPSAESGDAAADKHPPDQESHKRMFKVVPQFSIVDDASKTRPLTVREKWRLFYRQTIDPFNFVQTGISAGIGQAEDSFHDYGQGMEGYAKRYGAGFGDSTLGGFFGGFVLPSLFHDDPRYFRMGSGSIFRRGFYAVTRVLITRHDDGSPAPNYPTVMGAFIGTTFGNLYYPDSDRGVGNTFVRGAWVIEGAAAGHVFDEFWPDIHDKLFKKKKKKDEDSP